MKSKYLFLSRYFFPLFFISAVLLRMPQILGGNLLPDGDECIVGLMSKHVMEGKGFPLFLYGQNYGLTIFESSMTAVSFALFGVSVLPLKITVLLLWIVGAFFFISAARLFRGFHAGLFVALFLLLLPAWANAALNARGFYLTAFNCTGLSLWIIAKIKKNETGSVVNYGLIGILFGIIFLTQPLWLAASVPFVGLLVTQPSTRGRLYLSFLFFLLAPLLIVIINKTNLAVHYTPGVFDNPDPWTALRDMSFRMGVVFSGAYTYSTPVYIGPFSTISGIYGFFLAFVLIGYTFLNFIKHKIYSELTASSIAILLSLGVTLFMNNAIFGYRYLLAIPVLTAFGLGLTLPDFLKQKTHFRFTSIILFSVIGLCGILGYSEFSVLSAYDRASTETNKVGEVASMEKLISFLKTKKIRYVYCLPPLLQWNITFASRETILARWIHPQDRVPAYPLEIDKRLFQGEPVALVGFEDDMFSILKKQAYPDSSSNRPLVISHRYAVLLSPPVSLIRDLGFHLNLP
jgi:hypothetical protein